MGNAVPPTAPLTSPDVPPATLPLEETTMVVDQTMPLVLHIVPVFVSPTFSDFLIIT